MSNVVALESAAPLVVEQARELLARARTVDEAKQIADQGRALAVYVRARKAGLEAEQDAIEIVIRAKARIGEILAQLERDDAAAAGRKGGRGKRAAEVGNAPTQRAAALESAGISRKEAVACEKLAAAPAHVLELHIAGVRSRSEKLTTAGTIAAVSHGGDYDSDEWYTPGAVIEAARRVLGEIDVDPASCARAQKTVRAKKYYTRDDDGLSKPWRGRVWCNPPYSQPACSRFVEKFCAEAESGHMVAGIMLLNASTDTAWWHSLAERFVLCFTRGRLGFEREDGTAADGNRVGQVFAYHGGSRAFRSVFEPAVGIVLARP